VKETKKHMIDDINKNLKLLIAFVLDNSFSTQGLKVNNFIASFNSLTESIKNEGLSDYIELQLTVFDTPKSKTVKKFTDEVSEPIKQGRAPFLSEAIELSLQGISARKRKLIKLGEDSYKPWLFILTDGHSVDDVSKTADKLKEWDEAGKLLYMPFLLSDSVAVKIEPISINKRALVLKEMSADAFLKWVYEAGKIRITTQPNRGVRFDKKGLEGFAKL